MYLFIWICIWIALSSLLCSASYFFAIELCTLSPHKLSTAAIYVKGYIIEHTFLSSFTYSWVWNGLFKCHFHSISWDNYEKKQLLIKVHAMLKVPCEEHMLLEVKQEKDCHVYHVYIQVYLQVYLQVKLICFFFFYGQWHWQHGPIRS